MLHALVTAGKEGDSKMYLRVQEAYENFMADPTEANGDLYIKEAKKALTVWGPRKSRNVEFLHELTTRPEWTAQKENGDFILPPEDIQAQCDALGIRPMDARNIQKERRLLLMQTRQHAIANALRK